MIDAEPTPESSTGTEPAAAATGDKSGRGSKASAARDSPGSRSARIAGAAAGTDAVYRSSSRAQAAQPGFVSREYGAHAAAGSAGDALDADSSRAAAGLSQKGEPSSSGADTGSVKADGSLQNDISASHAVAERSTAHRAPLDSDVWEPPDGIDSKEQTSIAQTSPIMPCSATAAGAAAAGDSAGQAPAREAGRQPAGAGSTQREALSSTHTARTGKQQAAHDGQAPDLAQVCSCGFAHSTPPASPHGFAILHGLKSSILSVLHATWQA